MEHLTRVASSWRLTTPEQRATAWLHDIAEDLSAMWIGKIEQELGTVIADAVEMLTYRSGSYLKYVETLALDPIARSVKLADILDNLTDDPTDRQVAKYAKALRVLDIPFPRVVCAANRAPDGHVVLGIRHCDKFMREAHRLPTLYPHPGGGKLSAAGKVVTLAEAANLERSRRQAYARDQGFVDQYGNFLSRTTAWKLAKHNNQIIRDTGDANGELYSENLY